MFVHDRAPVLTQVPCCRELLCAPWAPEVTCPRDHHCVHILLVVLQTCRVPKALPTDGALVGLLPSVCPLVLPQQVVASERSPALSADVGPNARVLRLVATQRRGAGEGFVAPPAPERLLAGMDALVQGERIAVAVHLAAVLTQELPLACVPLQMHPEMPFPREDFATLTASMRLSLIGSALVVLGQAGVGTLRV